MRTMCVSTLEIFTIDQRLSKRRDFRRQRCAWEHRFAAFSFDNCFGAAKTGELLVQRRALRSLIWEFNVQ